ncbi:MAG: carboxypeptidase-like regulatory domain-containing protein, partial [Chloroflexota bacterium]
MGLQNVQVTSNTGGYMAVTDQYGNYTMASVAPGTYNVTATAAGYNSNFDGGVVVSSGVSTTASLALATTPLAVSMDTYNRYDQQGWGTSSDGNTWNADFNIYPLGSESIASTQGFVDTYTGQTDLDNWMGAAYPDQEVSADFSYSAVGQDSYLHGPRLLARVNGPHQYIDFAVNVTNHTLALWTNNHESWKRISSLVGVSAFAANTLYHTKLDVVGTSVYAKVWPASSAEPAWQVQASQSTLPAAGAGGVRTTYAYINWQNFKDSSLTSVAGVVTDLSGMPIAGATVSTGTGFTTTTNSSGAYVLPVRAGNYTV